MVRLVEPPKETDVRKVAAVARDLAAVTEVTEEVWCAVVAEVEAEGSAAGGDPPADSLSVSTFLVALCLLEHLPICVC